MGRKSSIEFLRIFSMFLIIINHYCNYIKWNNTNIVFNKVIHIALGNWGALSVDIFIIISAWFLCDYNSKFSIWKIIKMILETIFYSLLTLFLLTITNFNTLSISQIIKSVISPFCGVYWFITSYILFYILCPLVKIICMKLTDTAYKFYILTLTIIIPIYFTIFNYNENFGIISVFIYIFMLVSFLKSKENNFIERHCKIISLIVYIILVGGEYFSRIIENNRMIYLFREKWSILIIIQALCMFYMFKNLNIKNSRIINYMATSVFGVYIIHCFPTWIVPNINYLLWEKLLFAPSMYNNYLFISSILFVGIFILFFGIILDKLRIYFFEKPFLKMIYRCKAIMTICNKIDNAVNNMKEES